MLFIKTESATDGLIDSATFAEQPCVWNAHIIVHVEQQCLRTVRDLKLIQRKVTT